MIRSALGAGLIAAALLLATTARAEYRAYQLEVVDLYDCRMNKRKECHSSQITTAFDPNQYLLTHGGSYHIGVLMLATWMCYGDTSFYKVVCPRPLPRKPKFKQGDDVVITLKKHITEGWHGKVEVAYYQASVRSNVYGVRFPERRNVYARYYEKDIALAGAVPGSTTAAAGSAGAPAAPAASAPPATAAPAAAAPAPGGLSPAPAATAVPAAATAPAPAATPAVAPAGAPAAVPAPAAAPAGLAAPPTTTGGAVPGVAPPAPAAPLSAPPR
jgi:hypothetical protein